MGLPVIQRGSKEVDLGSAKVTIYEIGRDQAVHLAMGFTEDARPGESFEQRVTAAEVFMISVATDTPEDEVRKWRSVTPTEVVKKLTEAISAHSALGTDETPDPKSDTSGPS